MKKFINKQMFRTMELKASKLKQKAVNALSNNRGEPTTVSILTWCVVAVVVILLVLGLVYAFIKTEFFPALAKKVMDIFNFAG